VPTYKAVALEVKNTASFVPKACWIADCFEISGKQMRPAWNRVDRSMRKHLCPPEKRRVIINAIGKLAMEGK
jgi:hypothetical protein